VTVACNGGTFSGSISGNTLTYKGINHDGLATTCTAVIRGGAATADGACVADDSGESCTFTATRF
jgi:hypothetical protein